MRPAGPEAGADVYDDEEAFEGYDEEFGEGVEEARAPWRTVVGWVVTVALAVVLSLLIRSFVAHAFHVESSSMEPTWCRAIASS